MVTFEKRGWRRGTNRFLYNNVEGGLQRTTQPLKLCRHRVGQENRLASLLDFSSGPWEVYVHCRTRHSPPKQFGQVLPPAISLSSWCFVLHHIMTWAWIISDSLCRSLGGVCACRTWHSPLGEFGQVPPPPFHYSPDALFSIILWLELWLNHLMVVWVSPGTYNAGGGSL